MLTTANAMSVSDFIAPDVLCSWTRIYKIIARRPTNNGLNHCEKSHPELIRLLKWNRTLSQHRGAPPKHRETFPRFWSPPITKPTNDQMGFIHNMMAVWRVGQLSCTPFFLSRVCKHNARQAQSLQGRPCVEIECVWFVWVTSASRRIPADMFSCNDFNKPVFYNPIYTRPHIHLIICLRKSRWKPIDATREVRHTERVQEHVTDLEPFWHCY